MYDDMEDLLEALDEDLTTMYLGGVYVARLIHTDPRPLQFNQSELYDNNIEAIQKLVKDANSES